MKITLTAKPFSQGLQRKIDALLDRRKKTKICQFELPSALFLAPMASICNAPFRLLMQDLGAGATVSELISSHGINYKNAHTLEMLKIAEKENFVGIQLFGEDAESLAKSCEVAQLFGPNWIDLNLGCPVKKVVTKGAGSALLKNPKGLAQILSAMKKSLKVPLSIKIRTGWDQDQINADEIMQVAKEAGVSFVAIHGRTRAQQYNGHANWNYIEELATLKILPLIGNGDLYTPAIIRSKLSQTHCDGLMIGRGALKNPFIFLESYAHGPLTDEKHSFYSLFSGSDYFEVLERLAHYYEQFFLNERTALIQIKKFITWYAAGFPHAVSLRQKIFTNCGLYEAMQIAQDFFCENVKQRRTINYDEGWMSSGHG